VGGKELRVEDNEVKITRHGLVGQGFYDVPALLKMISLLYENPQQCSIFDSTCVWRRRIYCSLIHKDAKVLENPMKITICNINIVCGLRSTIISRHKIRQMNTKLGVSGAWSSSFKFW
jgi:hypothetical protein